MSALTVDRMLVALKTTVVLTGYRVKKVANPPDKEMLNVADPHF